MKSTEIMIPKEMTFKLPAGNFSAKITHVAVKRAKGSSSDHAHVYFSVDVKGMERFDCCARAIFPHDLREGSPLRCFMENLIGKRFFSEQSGQRIDLNTVLRDIPCQIELVHGKHDEQYDWPMVLVENVWPAETAKGGELSK